MSISLGLLFLHDWLFSHQQSSFRFKQPWIPKISRFVALKNRPENKTSPTKLTFKKIRRKTLKKKELFHPWAQIRAQRGFKILPNWLWATLVSVWADAADTEPLFSLPRVRKQTGRSFQGPEYPAGTSRMSGPTCWRTPRFHEISEETEDGILNKIAPYGVLWS